MPSLWKICKHCEPALVRLADRHYSRQQPGSREFTPPGRKLGLFVPRPDQSPLEPSEAWAGWVWWHPDVRQPYGHRRDGYDGWLQCQFFRNESPYKASELVAEAVALALELRLAEQWNLPDIGWDTYVEPDKVKSGVPGYCYLRSKPRWRYGGRSADGRKWRLYLPAGEVR